MECNGDATAQLCKSKFHSARTFEVALDKKEVFANASKEKEPAPFLEGKLFGPCAFPSFPLACRLSQDAGGRSSLGRENGFLR